MLRRVFSGMQPTGVPHIGNLIGAISQWSHMQTSMLQSCAASGSPFDRTQLMFCAVDLHALTSNPNPTELRTHTQQLIASLIACDIDPNYCVMYPQSAVSGHAELAWVLSCLSPVGRLERMTQFKDKSAKMSSSKICLGLFSYPVLMAADILLFRATEVPVGNDQKQHLELAQAIVTTFNTNYKTDFFTLPQPIYSEFPRIMSLRDGEVKMSKSDPSPNSRIDITDTADEIATKIRKATSDSISEIYYDAEARPTISNLLRIFSAMSGMSIDQSVAHFANQNTLQFKEALAQCLIERLGPIQRKRQEVLDSGVVDVSIREGVEIAQAKAHDTLRAVKQIVGLYI